MFLIFSMFFNIVSHEPYEFISYANVVYLPATHHLQTCTMLLLYFASMPTLIGQCSHRYQEILQHCEKGMFILKQAKGFTHHFCSMALPPTAPRPCQIKELGELGVNRHTPTYKGPSGRTPAKLETAKE